MYANSVDPDQTLHYAVSDQGLHCLPMSHKKDARPIWVKYSQKKRNIWNHVSIGFDRGIMFTTMLYTEGL